MFTKAQYTSTTLALLIFSSSSFAEKGDKLHRKGPPSQAKEACESKAENDSCSFEGRGHTVKGICLIMREDNVCVPEHHVQRMKEHRGLVDSSFSLTSNE